MSEVKGVTLGTRDENGNIVPEREYPTATVMPVLQNGDTVTRKVPLPEGFPYTFKSQEELDEFFGPDVYAFPEGEEWVTVNVKHAPADPAPKDKPKEDKVLVQAKLDRETYVYFCTEKARHDKENAELIADLLCKRHWADPATNHLLGLAAGVGTGFDCSKDKAVLIALHTLLGLLRWAEEVGDTNYSPERKYYLLASRLGFVVPDELRDALVRGAEAENG